MRKIDVLLVDDEIDNCELLAHFLRKYCPSINQIDVAFKFEEAVDLIYQKSYDLFFEKKLQN